MDKSILSILSDGEIEILKMRRGINFNKRFSIEEISNKFEITREQVCKIEVRALRKLGGISNITHFTIIK